MDCEDEYEVDAQPFCSSPTAGEMDEEPDGGEEKVVENPGKSSQDEFKVENSAVEISNSSGVHFGHNITQKTDITFEKAGSVLVDRRQWNYITYPESCKV